MNLKWDAMRADAPLWNILKDPSNYSFQIFFMIEPTEQNIKVYEGWTLSGSDQNKTFFGDIVVKCARVRLLPGNTFVIPSGMIFVASILFGSHSFQPKFSHKVSNFRSKYSI